MLTKTTEHIHCCQSFLGTGCETVRNCMEFFPDHAAAMCQDLIKSENCPYCPEILEPDYFIVSCRKHARYK